MKATFGHSPASDPMTLGPHTMSDPKMHDPRTASPDARHLLEVILIQQRKPSTDLSH